MKDTILLILAVFGIGFSLVYFTAWIGVEAGRYAVQREAIGHGAARWTIDPQTGEKAFEWIQAPSPAKE